MNGKSKNQVFDDAIDNALSERGGVRYTSRSNFRLSASVTIRFTLDHLSSIFFSQTFRQNCLRTSSSVNLDQVNSDCAN